MKKLIARFQKDLKISKGNAITRIFSIFILLLLITGTLIMTLVIFPYRSSYTDSMILPKGDYEVTGSMPDSNKYSIIETNYSELVKLHSEPNFVTSNKGQIVLIRVIDEKTVTYCNLKLQFSIKNSSYLISSIEKVKDSVAYIKYERQTTDMIMLNIVVPLLFIVIFLLVIIGMQSREYTSWEHYKLVRKYLVVCFKEKN